MNKSLFLLENDNKDMVMLHLVRYGLMKLPMGLRDFPQMPKSLETECRGIPRQSEIPVKTNPFHFCLNFLSDRKEMEGNFEVKSYNGVSIIRNIEDGYVNASQMCSSNNKKWRNYKNTHQWKACVEAFKTLEIEGVQNWAPSYYLENVAPKYQGEYIHPMLVHFVAEYCSVEYAFKVAHIMDKINEYSQATGQTFDETKDQLIAQLQATIDEQQQQIQQLETKIAQTSVPEENCDKDLFIVRVNGQLKLCADNTHKPTQFIRRYRFPAAMNVRQMIRDQFELTGVNIPNDRLEEVMTFINGLNPKERE